MRVYCSFSLTLLRLVLLFAAFLFSILFLYCDTTGHLHLHSTRSLCLIGSHVRTTDVANLRTKMTTDNSGLVHHLGYADSLNVTISICLTYTLIFTCVRIHLRRSSFGADDAVVVFATLAAMAHFAASYSCLTAGLGKPYDMIEGNLGRLNSVCSSDMSVLTIMS